MHLLLLCFTLHVGYCVIETSDVIKLLCFTDVDRRQTSFSIIKAPVPVFLIP